MDTVKKCTVCKLFKTTDRFAKDSSRGDGLNASCKPCSSKRRAAYYEANREREIAKTRAWDQAHPWKRTEYGRKRNFGVTALRYKEMYASQDGRCAICESQKVVLCVDHRHSTDTVRALLCRECNVALGMMRDTPELFDIAAAYLEGS